MQARARRGAPRKDDGPPRPRVRSGEVATPEKQDDVLEGTQSIADALGFRGSYVNVRRRVVGLIARHGLPAFKVAGAGDWKAQRAELLAWWEKTRAQLVRDVRAQLLEHEAAA